MSTFLGQAGAVLGVVGRSYPLRFFQFIELPNGEAQLRVDNQDPPHELTWSFGDGTAPVVVTDKALRDVSHAWMSPGVYDVTVTYFVTTSDTRKRATFTVRIGTSPQIALGEVDEDPYADNAPAVACVVKKLRVPGQSPRLAFGIVDLGPDTAEPGHESFGMQEIDSFFNLCKEVERLFASGIMRYPVPKLEELEDGVYGCFTQDVIYGGTGDAFREMQRRIGDALKWDYVHEVHECYPYRAYKLMVELFDELAQRDEPPTMIHAYRPFEFMFSEGKGLRLAREEILEDLRDSTVSELTVREKRALETKRREKKNYSLLWMRAILWPLSRTIFRYLDSIGMRRLRETIDGKTYFSIPMIVFNPDDLSLSVRIVNCIANDDPYGADLVSWRHVATQVNFVPTNDAEEVFAKHTLTPKRMYDDRTGEAVRVLPHDEAEALVGDAVQADEKIISINGAYYTFSASNRVLTPVGGGLPAGFGGGNLYAMMTTRGGGATTLNSLDDTPFLGSMVTVESWTSSRRVSTARWKGLAHTPEDYDPYAEGNELIVEGVDPDLVLIARQGVDGESLKVLPLSDFFDEGPYAEDPEYVCDIVLGPRDLGRFDAGGSGAGL